MRKSFFIVALLLVAVLVGCAEHEHLWKEVEVSKEATCTKEGERILECTTCEAKRTESIQKIDHNVGSDYKCSMCEQYFYPSLSEFNSKVTLSNSKGTIVNVQLGNESFGDIAYSEHDTGYTGKGLWIGRTHEDAEALNKYGATPAKAGEYKYVFNGGTIRSAVTGYKSIGDHNDASVYMLVPGNSDVVFENVTFEGVFSFDVQMRTSPLSYLNSIAFKNCTFNGIIVGICPANEASFIDCEFNSYTNSIDANNSNPIWWRASTLYWGQSSENSVHSLQKFVFEGNRVTGTRPVKIEKIAWDCHAEIVFKDNQFDITKQEGDTVTKNMAINIGQSTDKKTAFTLIDDGNVISENTASLYTAALNSGSNQYIKVSGTKILDGNGNPKEITALVWKTTTSETFTMKSSD